jgi:hypothetical protein
VSTVVIDADGSLMAIYDDELAGLLDEGTATITRASNVEPDAAGYWVATMADGAVLPACKLRAEALAAEVAYLERKLIE